MNPPHRRDGDDDRLAGVAAPGRRVASLISHGEFRERKDRPRADLELDSFVGARLCAARIASGLEVQGLAKICGVRAAEISAWEAGRRSAAAGDLWRIAQALGLKADTFFPQRTSSQPPMAQAFKGARVKRRPPNQT